MQGYKDAHDLKKEFKEIFGMNEFPKVTVCFWICGKYNESHLYNKLGIAEAETRGMDDWPDAIKRNNKLPEELQPRCEWSLEVEENTCIDIKIPLHRLFSVLREKLDVIREIVDCKKTQCGFTVTIFESVMMPEISLSREDISFLNFINSKIVFDIER
ncbi:MAG: hypothetical protein MJZ34_16075 [Paludibacteraceae bacterium]|nr:hypothetical protein [Paludibacteraceae bacterium]